MIPMILMLEQAFAKVFWCEKSAEFKYCYRSSWLNSRGMMKCSFPEGLFHSLLYWFAGPFFSLIDAVCHCLSFYGPMNECKNIIQGEREDYIERGEQ
jgi:hypothetical protein